MWQTGRFPSSHMIQSTANYKQCVPLANIHNFTGSATDFVGERETGQSHGMFNPTVINSTPNEKEIFELSAAIAII